MSDLTITDGDGNSTTIDSATLRRVIAALPDHLPPILADLSAFLDRTVDAYARFQPLLTVWREADGTCTLDWDWGDALLYDVEGESSMTADEAQEIETVLALPANRDTLTPAGRIIDGVFHPTARM